MSRLFESNETVQVGSNPLDFLASNRIQNGQFVSLGYFNVHKISLTRRYIDKDRDARLADLASKNGAKFRADIERVRGNEKYRAHVDGTEKKPKATTEFDFGGTVYIVKVGRFNFQWRNKTARDARYAEYVGKKKAIELSNGFDTDLYHTYPEGDWRNKYSEKARANALRQDKIRQERIEKGEPEPYNEPFGGPDADFYIYSTTKNINFTQIMNKYSEFGSEFFYVSTDGTLEPLTKDAYWMLAKTCGQKIEDAVEELISEEEQVYLDQLADLDSAYDFRQLNWNSILYFRASSKGKNADGKTEYTPQLWINKDVLRQVNPWLHEDEVDDLIHRMCAQSDADITEWEKTPKAWESVQPRRGLKSLSESRNAVRRAPRAIAHRPFGFDGRIRAGRR